MMLTYSLCCVPSAGDDVRDLLGVPANGRGARRLLGVRCPDRGVRGAVPRRDRERRGAVVAAAVRRGAVRRRQRGGP